MAEKIANLNVDITGKAGAGTRLYGSVTNQEIADALAEPASVKVDKRMIHITRADQEYRRVRSADQALSRYLGGHSRAGSEAQCGS